jgi:hypothetical protein
MFALQLTISIPLNRSAVRVFELGHALCVGHTLYSYTISDHSGPPWTLPQAFVLAGLIVACGAYNNYFSGLYPRHSYSYVLVQGFFGLRIYRLSKKLSIPVIIWVMALLRLMASTIIFELPVNPALGYHADTKQELLTTSSWILGVANDLLITATLVFVLRRQRADVHQRYGSKYFQLYAHHIQNRRPCRQNHCLVHRSPTFVFISYYFCTHIRDRNWNDNKVRFAARSSSSSYP